MYFINYDRKFLIETLKKWKLFNTVELLYHSCFIGLFFMKIFYFLLALGVLICLDHVSIEGSRQLRKSQQRQKVSLDDRDISISSRHQCPDQKILIKIENFVKIWKFWSVSTVCLDLDREVHGFLYFLIEISQSVETFHHFQTQKALTISRFLDKSWLRLDKSWQKSRLSQKSMVI